MLPDKSQITNTGVALFWIAWSPDNRTMYFADTPAGCIYAYDHDLERGEISQRRVFAQFKAGEGGPDGLTVDAEGGVWCALFNRSELHHIAPSGQPIQVIDLPVQQPTSVMFGGPDLGTLFITTARIRLPSRVLAEAPFSGGLFTLPVDVPGLAAAEFGG